MTRATGTGGVAGGAAGDVTGGSAGDAAGDTAGDVALHERLSAYLRNLFGSGVNVTGFRTINDGWESQILAFDAVGEHLAIRLYAPGREPWLMSRLEKEFLLMRRLREVDYPVPRVISLERDESHLGGAFILMQQLRGKSLGHLYTQGSEEDRRRIIDIYSSLSARLHSLDTALFMGSGRVYASADDALSTVNPRVMMAPLSSSGSSSALAPVFDWIVAHEPALTDGPLRLTHGDYHLWNILFHDDHRPYVLDWGQGGLNDIRHDIAYASVLAETQGRPELALAIVSGYERASGARLDGLDLFIQYALLRRFGGALISLLEGPERLGMRPEIRPTLEKQVVQLLDLCRLTALRTGINLSDAQHALEQYSVGVG